MACSLHLVRERLADLLYLSLADFVQHTYAPDTPKAYAFYSAPIAASPNSTPWVP